MYNYPLLKAISESYKDYLPPEKYPFVIINLELIRLPLMIMFILQKKKLGCQ